MRRIVVTFHDSYYIAYGHMFSVSQSMIEYIKNIYLDYYDTEFPMYVFLERHTFVLYPKSKNMKNESILEHAGIFSRLKFPDTIPKTHNIHRFKLEVISDEIIVNEEDHTFDKSTNDKLINQLTSALELYSSDLYQIVVPFDVIYCDHAYPFDCIVNP